MNCNDVRQHWMLYFDSEGDAEMHLRISDHLGMCPACAEWFARQQRFEQGFSERLAAGEATPDLWKRALSLPTKWSHNVRMKGNGSLEARAFPVPERVSQKVLGKPS